jgi:hypothetical protein
LLTVIAVTCGWAPALAASGRRLAITAKPRVVEYTRPVAISGHAGRRRGVGVALEVNRFPFESGFATAERGRTRRGGAYAFRRPPTHAVQYRIAFAHDPSTTSRTVQTYVEPRFTRRRCNICGASSSHRGSQTLRISFRMLYPADTFDTELPKRVFFYYGQRNGSADPPGRLHLAETVEQHRLAHHRSRVVITHRVHLPDRYRFAVAVCTRTSMRSDGLGLPGAPGSRGCGRTAISYSRSRHWLG